MRPRDLLLGDELLDKDAQNRLIAQIEAADPYMVAIEFPCDPWTALSFLWSEDTVRRKREVGTKILDFVRRLVEHRVSRNRHVWLDNPRSLGGLAAKRPEVDARRRAIRVSPV